MNEMQLSLTQFEHFGLDFAVLTAAVKQFLICLESDFILFKETFLATLETCCLASYNSRLRMALCLSFIIFFVMRLALIFFSHKYRAKRRIIKSREYEETFFSE